MRDGARLDARTVFISDLHLGTRGCEADRLLAFLARTRTERLVLLGDVVDLWSLKRDVYWPESHHAVLRAFVEFARRGTEVIYVPGNHDGAFRELCGVDLAGIEVCRELVHRCADGRRFLVVHGDMFDGAVQFSPALRRFGAALYDATLWLGSAVHAGRGLLGLRRWSLATWLKQRVPDARRYVERYERAAAHEALRRGLDGVICGHIHQPGLRELDGTLYCNDGDWVEHCTALVENRAGALQLVVAPDAPAARATAVPVLDRAA